jgi:hypothetical protein
VGRGKERLVGLDEGVPCYPETGGLAEGAVQA